MQLSSGYIIDTADWFAEVLFICMDLILTSVGIIVFVYQVFLTDIAKGFFDIFLPFRLVRCCVVYFLLERSVSGFRHAVSKLNIGCNTIPATPSEMQAPAFSDDSVELLSHWSH